MADEQNPEILTLISQNGEETDFVEIAQIPYDGKQYLILQPAEPTDDVEDDEAFVFSVTQTDDGERYSCIDDEAIIEGVFSEYYRLCDEEES